MTIIICIDERLGISFGGKRQSKDRVLTRDIVSVARGHRLLIGEYSVSIFKEADISFDENNIFVSDRPEKDAKSEDFLFLERGFYEDIILSASSLIIYSWGRHYPSDVQLKRDCIDDHFELFEEYNFEGKSHKNLTRYTLNRKKSINFNG